MARKNLSNDELKFLQEVASFLRTDAIAEPERQQALGFAKRLDVLAPKSSKAERLEINVAMDYEIRKELAGPGNWKRARAETATAHNVTDNTVSTYYSRWSSVAGKGIDTWIAKTYSHIERAAALRMILGMLWIKA